MLDNDPLGFELRYRANRTRKPRGVLTSRGINHEGSADGHEKFSSQALQMGPVGFGIYAFRDKASGRVLHGVVVPNARKATTIGHVYLDMASLRRGKCFSPRLDSPPTLLQSRDFGTVFRSGSGVSILHNVRAICIYGGSSPYLTLETSTRSLQFHSTYWWSKIELCPFCVRYVPIF
ncbi:hypothetical protein C8Q80DRAFT_198952 [Daedaleopsis nitida]|nr:hypothetical protein C8Q80DRAFT_198952 [Daedaleopsis nitida]